LQQKLNNFRMQVAANQHFGRSADKLQVCGRDIVVDINHTLRQNETIEVGKDTRKSFGICEAHWPHVGIPQEGLDGGRLSYTNDPDSIHLAVI